MLIIAVVVLIKNSAYIFMVLILVGAYCPDVVVRDYVRLVPRPSPAPVFDHLQ